MLLIEIKYAIAAYLRRSADELIVNSVDLSLIALNEVRKEAELENDFGFSRKLMTVPVSGSVGGSLDEAVVMGTDTHLEVRSIIDVGLFDEFGNLNPVEWTSVAESMRRQREENPLYGIRYPTDAQAVIGPLGQRRFTFAGDDIYVFPRTQDTTVTFTLGFEAFTFTPDWTVGDINSEQEMGPWTKHGHQYLLWASVIRVNKLFQEFVPRQEGNLAEPSDLATAGLEKFKTWDTYKYEGTRTHGR